MPIVAGSERPCLAKRIQGAGKLEMGETLPALIRIFVPHGPNVHLKGAPRRAAVLVAALTLAALVACGLPSRTPAKVAHVGFLETGAPGPTAEVVQGFVRGLQERGWEDGKNIALDLRFAEGVEDRLPTLAQELLDMHVDVLVTATTQASRTAQGLTSTTPIVFAGLADPVGAGLIATNAQPGGNLTGTSLMTSHLVGKHLEILKETVPGLSRVAILVNPSGPSVTALGPMQDAARVLGIQTLVLYPTTPDDLEPSLDEAVTQNANAIIALPDALFFNNRPEIIRAAAVRGLPDLYWERSFGLDGGFLSYGGNRAEAFRRAAGYVDKVLKGARPQDLPVEDASQFDFVVNRTTQRRLALTIPPSLAEAVTEWMD